VEEFVNEKLEFAADVAADVADVAVVAVVAVAAVAAAAAVAVAAVVAVVAVVAACTMAVGFEYVVDVEEEDIVAYDQKYRAVDDDAVHYLIMDLMMLHHEQPDNHLTEHYDHVRKRRGTERMISSEEPGY
jgi:hypothetical protein